MLDIPICSRSGMSWGATSTFGTSGTCIDEIELRRSSSTLFGLWTGTCCSRDGSSGKESNVGESVLSRRGVELLQSDRTDSRCSLGDNLFGIDF